MTDSGPVMKITEILEILPHRYPFLLVDRIVALEPGKRATGIKNVTMNVGLPSRSEPARRRARKHLR